MPFNATVVREGSGWKVTVENHADRALTAVHVVVDGYVLTLGDVPANGSKTFNLTNERATPLRTYVNTYGGTFQTAVQARQRTFGGAESGRIDDLANGTMASSFLSQLGGGPGSIRNFITPPGLDLSSVAEHGNAIVLAWAGDYAPTKPLYQFSPRRAHRNTLWRLAVPVQSLKSQVSGLKSQVSGLKPGV